jgi:serine/threonine-protein kinase HipA
VVGVAEGLAVWLYGQKIALIYRNRNQLRLQYTNDALSHYDLGTPLLSLSLPLRSERYTHLPVKTFLDGLLPEGDARGTVSRGLGLGSDDTYGLIRGLGRDCAGAIVVLLDDEAAPPAATTSTARPLSESELASLVANLREAPLGAGGRVRISLAGIQEKLLLTRMPNGSWGQPIDGTPSTHILKPEIARFPNTVENELFCMRTAKYLGLPVAEVDTMIVGGRKMIIVERFDRVVHEEGSVSRLHQEDLCQATETSPDQKYEESGGPSLKQIATILQQVASPESVETLLEAVVLNVLIGNGDAHAKNFSLIHEQGGRIRLAPLYDLMSTLIYQDDRLAMFIDGVHRTERATVTRIVNEAAHWGMSRRRAGEIVLGLLDRFEGAVQAAAEQTPGVPEAILDVCREQLTMVKSEQP